MIEYPITYHGVCDVQANFQTYFKLLLNKAMSLFKVDGLPETISKDYLLEHLILSGRVCFAEFDGKLYALDGNEGGEPNAYYMPQQFIIANPILGSKMVKIRHKDGREEVEGLDGILVALTKWDNVSNSQKWNGGLYNLIYKYAGLLADNDVSLNIAQINGRLSVVFTADEEAEAREAEKALEAVYAGKPYKVLVQDILEKITATPVANAGTNNTIMSLIEAHAHLLQDFYSEIGIASQGNLKRERVNTAETELMTGCLDISIWNMIDTLKKCFERVNERFGTSITIELNDEVFYDGSANATLGQEDLSQVENTEEDVSVSESTDEAIETAEEDDDKEEQEEKDGEA